MLTAYMPSNPLLKGKDFAWLGRIIYAAEPVLAGEIISKYYATDSRPQQTDLGKIAYFLRSFCLLESIEPTELKRENRRVFVAVCLCLYRPKAFIGNLSNLQYKDGLNAQLMKVLGCRHASICEDMKTVTVWYKNNSYGFRDKVDGIVGQLKEAA